MNTKILFVDDEQAYTRMISHALEDSGKFEVCTENDSTQALKRAQLFKPEIIVLDIIMPEISGLEVAEQLKNDPGLSNTPVIFLTAAVSKEQPQIQHDLLGGYPVLVKPVGTDELIACIEETLQVQS